MPYDPHIQNPYGYEPSLIIGVVFSSLFGISAVIHAIQAIIIRNNEGRRYRWLWAFVLGALAESIGWAARAAAHYCSYSVDIFKMQLSILVIGKHFHICSLPISNPWYC